jgi:hypothetical protein
VNRAWLCRIAALCSVVFAVSCGGDACQTLADEIAACGGGTTSSTSSGATTGGPPVCSDQEKQQAQCVIDAKIDICKIKSMTATAADQSAYTACYSK